MSVATTPGAPEANRLVERHREVFAAYFPLTRRMQVRLGRRHEADPGFAAHYDGIRAGLAGWLRQAADAGARAHGIDPDSATRTPRPGHRDLGAAPGEEAGPAEARAAREAGR